MISLKPPRDPQVLRSLIILDANTDYQRVIGWMVEELQRQHEDNAQEFDETLLRQGQGAASVLATLTRLSKQARAALREVEAVQRAPSKTVP